MIFCPCEPSEAGWARPNSSGRPARQAEYLARLAPREEHRVPFVFISLALGSAGSSGAGQPGALAIEPPR